MRIVGIVLLVAGASVGCSGGLAEEISNEARNDFLAECEMSSHVLSGGTPMISWVSAILPIGQR